MDHDFSLFDHLRPCLNSCFPCLHRSTQSHLTTQPNYFPDSDHRGLLEDLGRDDLDYPQQSQRESDPNLDAYFKSSQLSRWDLLLSWLSSKLFHHHAQSSLHSIDLNQADLEPPSALRPIDLEDALILDDISISLKSRLTRPKIKAPTPNSPHLDRSSHPKNHKPSNDRSSKRLDKQKYASNIPHSSSPSAHIPASPNDRSRSESLIGLVLASSESSSPSHHRPSSSKGKSTRSQTTTRSSRLLSSGSPTDESGESELFSLPTLTSTTSGTSIATTTTTRSSNFGHDHPSELNFEIIKFIHQTYNQKCRKLYGRDLSRYQIQQIYDHLISRARSLSSNSSNPSAGSHDSTLKETCEVEPIINNNEDLSSPTTDTTTTINTIATNSEPNESIQSDRQSISNFGGSSSLEVESLKRINLSTEEFLRAIKETKKNSHKSSSSSENQNNPQCLSTHNNIKPNDDHQILHHSSSSSSKSLNELTNFELEEENDLSNLILIPDSILDLISKSFSSSISTLI